MTRKIVSSLLLGLFWIGLAQAQTDEGQEGMQDGELWSGWWEISLWGYSSTGRCCWLVGPGQEVRAEISQEIAPQNLPDSAPPLLRQDFWPPLLNRTGQGWTAVLGSSATGTLQAWGREWEALQPALGTWILALLGTLDKLGVPLVPVDLPAGVRLLAPGPGRFGSSRLWARPVGDRTRPASLRLELPGLALERDAEVAEKGNERRFRQDMLARGGGRGGAREIVCFANENQSREKGGAADEPMVFTVTSSRKPGKLILHLRTGWRVSYYFPEVFSPLWPLADLVEPIF